MDNDITFFMNSAKRYPYYSKLYPIFNREPMYFEKTNTNALPFPYQFSKKWKHKVEKQLINHSTILNQ